MVVIVRICDSVCLAICHSSLGHFCARYPRLREQIYTLCLKNMITYYRYILMDQNY